MSKELGLTILIAAATGGDPGIVNEIITNAISSGFDRSMEKEADVFAFKLLNKAQIHPDQLTRSFIRLKTQESMNLDGLEVFMSHPNLKTRIEYLSKRTIDTNFIESPILVDIEAVQHFIK